MRLLVLRLDEIGDFVLTSSFLRELRRSYPEAKITLVVKPQVKNLAETCPYINTLLTFDPRKKRRWKRALFSLLYLRRYYFDLVIIPRWGPDDYGANDLAFWSGGKRRVGYTNDPWRLTDIVPDCSQMHEVEKNLHVLTFLGHHIKSHHLELWPTEEDRAQAALLLEGLPKPWIALGIGASKKRKIWPITCYQKLCSSIQGSCIVIGGPEDQEAGNQLQAVNLAGKLTLRESAAVIEQCSLYIGNDSGPMHIAAAVGTPVIEISCHALTGAPNVPSDPARFGPWTTKKCVVRPQVLQSPCTQECRSREAHCILGVEVADVLKEIASFTMLNGERISLQ